MRKHAQFPFPPKYSSVPGQFNMGRPMLILSLTYKVPLDQADAQMEPHMAWVKRGYAEGYFLASGRKQPRTGGVILAKGERAVLERLCAEDPFVIHGIADYDITEVILSTTAPGLDTLKG
jgi:uncharacterized protein YciI